MSDGSAIDLTSPGTAPGRGGATERRSVALVLLFATLVPALVRRALELLPLDWVEGWLIERSLASWVESSMLAELAVRPLEDLASYGPGLCALWLARRHIAQTTRRPARHVGRNTIVALCVTLVTVGLLHGFFDLPTGFIAGPRTRAAISLHAKLIMITLNSFWSPFGEEYYYRHALWNWVRPHLRARTTVMLTAASFAVGHPPELVLWAFVVGLFVGVVRERAGHIGPTLAFHCIWNAVAYADAWGLI